MIHRTSRLFKERPINSWDIPLYRFVLNCIICFIIFMLLLYVIILYYIILH